MCHRTVLLFGLITVFLTGRVIADDSTIILRSTVKGNQEQPKVLYLLPWRQADAIEWDYQPSETVMAEVFEPVDREEFIRELHYRELLRPNYESKNAR